MLERRIRQALPSFDCSIRYPITRAPRSLAGAVHAKSMTDVPRARAVRLVGAPGTSGVVVVRAVNDRGPSPAELTADTW